MNRILKMPILLLTAFSVFAEPATHNVVDFGADPTGAKASHWEIRKAIDKAQSGDVVFFPKGRYFIEKCLWVYEKKKVTFRGEPGTVIVTHCNPWGDELESPVGFQLTRCEDVVIENFTFTTDNPIGCVGTVLGTDGQANTIDFRIDDDFPATGREHFFQLNTYEGDGTPDGALETHQDIREKKLADGTTVYEGLPYQLVAPRVARIQLPKWAGVSAVTNGHRMLVRYFRRFGSPLALDAVKRVRVENFEIERTPFVGCVVSPPSEDITFRRFSIRPKVGDPNVCASNADGIHFNACGGSVVLEDCHFVGLGDDALNVHCLGAEVKTYDPATGKIELHARGGTDRKPHQIEPNWAEVGQTLEFYDPKTLQLKGRAKLKAFVNDRSGRGELETDDFQPQVGDFVANGNYFPSVRISNCSVRNTRARAFLLQTRNVLVENCVFYGLKSAAVLLVCDMVFWNEMGPVVNAEVRNCSFEKCAKGWPGRDEHYYGALAVKGKHGDGLSDAPAGLHRNIRFLNNTFEDIGSQPIFVESTDGVEIRGNRYENCANDRNPPPEMLVAPVRLHNCTNVVIDCNRY